MSAPLSALEFRLEQRKRISNLKLDLLQRLGYGRSVIERYSGGEHELHIHFRANEGMVCAAYRPSDCGETGRVGLVEGMRDEHCVVSSDPREFPMFVWIGNVPEYASPLASCVRLQPLNCCGMCGVDALEQPARLSPIVETLFRVFNRKLCGALLDAGIELSEFEYKIVESASQVVGDLPDEYTDNQRWSDAIAHIWNEIVRRIRIELRNEGIFLLYQPFGECKAQISKVFLCPRYSFERAIEYVIGHGIHSE